MQSRSTAAEKSSAISHRTANVYITRMWLHSSKGLWHYWSQFISFQTSKFIWHLRLLCACAETELLVPAVRNLSSLCASRGIATVSHPSFLVSVRLSVTLLYRGRMCWVSSKVITWIISLGSSILGASTSVIKSKGITIKIRVEFGWNRGGVTPFSRKTDISLKLGKIEPRLLLMTNRKWHMRFRMAPKSMILDDLERPFRTLFQNTSVFGAHHENLNEGRPILSAAKM